jgi:hypothetical protein
MQPDLVGFRLDLIELNHLAQTAGPSSAEGGRGYSSFLSGSAAEQHLIDDRAATTVFSGCRCRN